MESADKVFENALDGIASLAASKVVHLGVDLGTNTTVLCASVEGRPLPLEKDAVTTVVGIPKSGIIPGILPADASVLFGEEAIEYRLHLDLRSPLREGFVDDLQACRLFAAHLRDIVGVDDGDQIWGVVGAPANASAEREKTIRSAVSGFLDRILIVPEPFLAAMGLREDEGFRDVHGTNVDPTKHSLIVDIGAGTTDLCLVRGYFPTAEDLISINRAGDHIDSLIHDAIRRRYPDIKLTAVTVRNIKEQHSFVSGFEREARVKVYVDGRPRTLDFGAMISDACDALVPLIVDGIKELLKRCDSDSAVNVMENIIVTGGGSQIQGLPEKIQAYLRDEEYDCARCIVPADYKRLVARGALKIAENVRDDQWQFSI